MIQKSHDDRMLWAQFDALEMGSGWEDTDILKPQIMIESVYGDSHPGSTHLNQMVEQAVYGVYQTGGKPAKYYATDICDGCAQGHDGMNVVLASREAIANMVEVHASAVPWDGMILASSCDKSIPAHLKAAARMDIPTIFMPGGSCCATARSISLPCPGPITVSAAMTTVQARSQPSGRQRRPFGASAPSVMSWVSYTNGWNPFAVKYMTLPRRFGINGQNLPFLPRSWTPRRPGPTSFTA